MFKKTSNIIDEDQSHPEKPSIKLILIVALIFSILAIIGGVVFYSIQKNDSAVQELSEESGGDMSATEVGVMYPLDTFRVNLLSDDGNDHYLKVDMDLEIKGKDLDPELDKKKAEIRDIIIEVLSSKSMEQVMTSNEKSEIKQEIIDKINMHLAKSKVKNVYFTNFLEQ